MYAVYALIDPRDNLVRYVGMTEDVYRRFSNHVNCSGGNYAKTAWIMELRELNKMVIMTTLEEVSERELALKREQYWINHFEMLGSPIMNIMGVVSSRGTGKARRKKTHVENHAEANTKIKHVATPTASTRDI